MNRVRVVAASDLIDRVVIVFEPTHLLGDNLFVRTQEADGVRRHYDTSGRHSSRQIYAVRAAGDLILVKHDAAGGSATNCWNPAPCDL